MSREVCARSQHTRWAGGSVLLGRAGSESDRSIFHGPNPSGNINAISGWILRLYSTYYVCIFRFLKTFLLILQMQYFEFSVFTVILFIYLVS